MMKAITMAQVRNKIAARCYRCGKHCEPGTGHVEIVTDAQKKKWPNATHWTKWLVQHEECAVKYRGTKVHYRYAPDGAVAYGGGRSEGKSAEHDAPVGAAELEQILNIIP